MSVRDVVDVDLKVDMCSLICVIDFLNRFKKKKKTSYMYLIEEFNIATTVTHTAVIGTIGSL